IPEVHWIGDTQGEPGGNSVAAWAGVGARIEVTSGNAMTAVNPSVRTICRRFIPPIMKGGGSMLSSNKLSFANWSSAYQISFSSQGAFSSRDKELQTAATVVSPSQYCQTLAAVSFKQWALFRSRS